MPSLSEAYKLPEGLTLDDIKRFSSPEQERTLPEGLTVDDIQRFSQEEKTGEGEKSSLGAFARTAMRIPENLAAKTIMAVQGQTGASVADRGIADRFVNWVEERNRKLAEEYEGRGDFIPGVISKKDIAELGPNLAFSGVSMGGTIGGGAIGGMAGAPGGPLAVGGAIAGGVAGGATAAYRMDSYQVMNDWLEKVNKESIDNGLGPISKEAEEKFKAEMSDLATKHGLWEAGPEGVGNVLELALMTAKKLPGVGWLPKGMVGKLAKGVTRFAGTLGTEQITETVTQMGQQQAEVEAGMSDEAARQWTSADDILKSAEEVLPQVLMLTGAMTTGGAIYRKATKGVESLDKQTPEQLLNKTYQDLSTGTIGPEHIDMLKDQFPELKPELNTILAGHTRIQLERKLQDAESSRRGLEEAGREEEIEGPPERGVYLGGLTEDRLVPEPGETEGLIEPPTIVAPVEPTLPPTPEPVVETGGEKAAVEGEKKGKEAWEMSKRDWQEQEGIETPSDYLYHGTPAKNLENIIRDGLQSKTRERNDWEEGDRTPQEQELLYFEKNENKNWGGKEDVQLRIDPDKLPQGVDIAEDELRRGEFYTYSFNNESYDIPPDAIEYYDKKLKKWLPLFDEHKELTKQAIKEGKIASHPDYPDLTPTAQPEKEAPGVGKEVTKPDIPALMEAEDAHGLADAIDIPQGYPLPSFFDKTTVQSGRVHKNMAKKLSAVYLAAGFRESGRIEHSDGTVNMSFTVGAVKQPAPVKEPLTTPAEPTGEKPEAAPGVGGEVEKEPVRKKGEPYNISKDDFNKLPKADLLTLGKKVLVKTREGIFEGTIESIPSGFKGKNAQIKLSNGKWRNVDGYRGSPNVKSYPTKPPTEEGVKAIPYTKDLDIRNVDALPRGTGARYLEVIEGADGAFVAKQWRRKPIGKGILIDMTPDVGEGVKAALAEIRTKTNNQPFRSEKAARGFLRRAKKSEFDYDLVKEGKGYIWREKAEKLTPVQKKILEDEKERGLNRQRAREAKTFRMWLKYSGGIQRKD